MTEDSNLLLLGNLRADEISFFVNLASALLAFFAFDKFVLDPQRDEALKATLNADNAVAVEEAREAGRSEAVTTAEENRSIAVLAFDDMSPEGDQEYLSDGIAEELLNLLAKIPELRVISRSSAFSFKGRNLELTEIGKPRNVAHILLSASEAMPQTKGFQSLRLPP